MCVDMYVFVSVSWFGIGCAPVMSSESRLCACLSACFNSAVSPGMSVLKQQLNASFPFFVAGYLVSMLQICHASRSVFFGNSFDIKAPPYVVHPQGLNPEPPKSG